MTASRFIKAQGLTSAVYVAAQVGVTPWTVNYWYNNNFRHLELVVKGLLYEREENE